MFRADDDLNLIAPKILNPSNSLVSLKNKNEKL